MLIFSLSNIVKLFITFVNIYKEALLSSLKHKTQYIRIEIAMAGIKIT